MDSDPAGKAPRKHTNGWMTVLALCLLAVGLLACLYVLIGFPAEAQVVGDSTTMPAASPSPAPAYHSPANPSPGSSGSMQAPRRQPLQSYPAPQTLQRRSPGRRRQPLRRTSTSAPMRFRRS